ncbi:uncharacterized protein [Clinocottus analis]|uniref:uncharacterized protein n=1 Tax=Clinocottus analis TaxID=304258 RepID=UPI0035BFA33F
MFLDHSSFNKVHVLLQRLRNLLTLAQWARRQLGSAHLWHGAGVPCVVCRDTFGSADVRRGCWNRERRALKQHIWLGRLVQWWGITGLLPKYPGTDMMTQVLNLYASQLMYFVLDMANFLQCKDDLLQSFCHAFTISSSFSQQIRAFWMLDHGHIKGSMELLLSPRAAAPRLSWQHRCIIHCLLTRKQPQFALSCVSGAWALLKRSLECLPAGYSDEGDIENGTKRSQLPLVKNDLSAGRPPCPLSAKLYQAHSVHTVSPEELVQLLRKAAVEVRKPHPKISEMVWPQHRARKWNSREMLLSTQALRHLTSSPSPTDRVEETEQTPHADEPGEEKPVHNQPQTPEHISCEEEEEGEEESRTPSSVDALPDCPEQTMAVDGATDPTFVCNLNKDIVVELLLSAEEKMSCCKGEEIIHGPSDVSDLRSSALPLNQEEQPGCIPSHMFSFSFSEGLSCALSETTQDLPTTDLHRSPLSEDPVASSSRVSAGTGQQDISLLTAVCSSIFPTQLQISGSSLTPRLTYNIITTMAPSGTDNENSPEAQLKVDELCSQSTSTLLDHCKMGSWWEQELETCRASTGLRPAPEPAASITSDNKRHSLVLSQPYSYSLINFRDFTAKQKGDSRNGKQTDKEEPAGWTSSGTGSQGAMRSGRTLLRKGKRGKRA